MPGAQLRLSLRMVLATAVFDIPPHFHILVTSVFINNIRIDFSLFRIKETIIRHNIFKMLSKYIDINIRTGGFPLRLL